jgi:hypothetical protein
MPAFCTGCGLVFGSGFVIEDSTNIHIQNFSSSCPRCGSIAKIPDGVYNVLGGVIELLSGPTKSARQLRSLQQKLRHARAHGESHENVQSLISKNAPELSSIVSSLPKTRGELYAFLTVLITLLGILVNTYAARRPSGPTQAEIEAMVAKALSKSAERPAPLAPQPNRKRNKSKVGRNASCPCGSGEKFKRCCLDKMG